MNHLLLTGFFTVLLNLAFSTTVLAESLTIAGTGDSQLLLRSLGRAFEQQNPGSHIIVPESVGSGGGVHAVTVGKVALARTARPLKAKELKGAGASLKQLLFASSPIVFATHSALTFPAQLTSQQIQSIYSGKVKDWNQLRRPENRTKEAQKIYPTIREEGDSSRIVLERSSSKFTFSSPPAKVFFSNSKAAAAIRDHRQTIGFLPNNWAQDHQLHVLTIDGLSLNETPYMTPFYLVTHGEPKGLAKQFINFTLSETGQAIIVEQGMVP